MNHPCTEAFNIGPYSLTIEVGALPALCVTPLSYSSGIQPISLGNEQSL